jgi:hypothetical protein
LAVSGRDFRLDAEPGAEYRREAFLFGLDLDFSAAWFELDLAFSAALRARLCEVCVKNSQLGMSAGRLVRPLLISTPLATGRSST